MDLNFRLSRNLQALDLRFPFRLIWQPVAGSHVISIGAHERAASPHSGWIIPAEKLFSVSVTPGIEGYASGRLSIACSDASPSHRPDWRALLHAYRDRSASFGLALAQEIFRNPHYAWSLDEISALLDVRVRDLRMRLFREDYGFASTLRRCRALRLLLSALCYDFPRSSPGVAESEERMDSILDHSFSVRFSTLARIRLPAHPQ